MKKPESDALSRVPKIKAIIVSEKALREINRFKKQVKEAKKSAKGNTEINLELSLSLRLGTFLEKFQTSLEKLEEEIGIPKNILKEFFVCFFKENVFPEKT